MTTTDTRSTGQVLSRDGTPIAYWASGSGRPLLLVHGTTADHTRWAPVLPYLEPHVTVAAMDRRGRGGSGDAAEYDVRREYEDVAAVADALAEEYGEPVDVLGHSFGGMCAWGAALLTPAIRRLALYEGWPSPQPQGFQVPEPVEQRMRGLIAEGRRETALEVFFREVVRMPEQEFAAYRALPAWRARIAAAHTILRETREPVRLDVAEARRIRQPVLLLVGADSSPELQDGYQVVAEALPDARVVVLPGQQHVAMDFVPELFSARVLGFLTS